MHIKRIGVSGPRTRHSSARPAAQVAERAEITPGVIRTICLIAGLWAGVGAARCDESFAIDAGHTLPAFEVMHFGMTTQRGRFDRASGQVRIDFAAHRGSVTLIVDMRSIDVGSESANQLLKSALMLNVERHPTMQFVSHQVEFAGDTVIGADGVLTLAGVSRPLRIAVTGFGCRVHPLFKRRLCGGDVSANLRRSDFGLTEFLPDIGDVVRIDMPIESLSDQVDDSKPGGRQPAAGIPSDAAGSASGRDGSLPTF